MLGKSVLPRVLVRVTLLLPAHLPVLTLHNDPTLNTYLRKLESWDQYGGMCVGARTTQTTKQETSSRALILVCLVVLCVLARANTDQEHTQTQLPV